MDRVRAPRKKGRNQGSVFYALEKKVCVLCERRQMFVVDLLSLFFCSVPGSGG